MGMKGYLGYFIAVLICISIMTNIVEHLFMYFLAISISPLENCLDSFVTLTFHFPLLPAFHSPGPNPVSFTVPVNSLFLFPDLEIWLLNIKVSSLIWTECSAR